MKLTMTRVSLLAFVFGALMGCGGSSSSGGGTTTPPPTTPDMGTVAVMNDGVEYTITNASSGAVLGV